MAKRGKKVRGGLFRRGGMWWGRWTAYGVENRRSTQVRAGGPDSKAKAQAVLDGWTAAYRAEDVADLRAALAERQRDAEERAAEARRKAGEAESRIPLDEAWERHPYDMSQRTKRSSRVHRLSELNIRGNRQSWGKFVRWAKAVHGEGLAMQDVTPEMAAEWSRALQEEGITPQYHNQLIVVANVMFRLAGLESPFASVDRLRTQEAEHREPFTKEQVSALLASAEGEWRGFLAVLYYTGLRRGDAVLLRAEQRDRRTGKLRVAMAKTGKFAEPCEHPELTPILDDLEPKGGKGYFFPSLAAAYFHDAPSISAKFSAFMERVLGFDGKDERRGGGKNRVSRYGLHSFRHSFASHAAQAGVSLGALQAWLGHSSDAITRIYAHYGTAAELGKIMAGVSLESGKATS